MFYIQYLKKFINNLETIRFVEKYLDCINDVDEFKKFVEFLKVSCRYKPHNILW